MLAPKVFFISFLQEYVQRTSLPITPKQAFFVNTQITEYREDKDIDELLLILPIFGVCGMFGIFLYLKSCFLIHLIRYCYPE